MTKKQYLMLLTGSMVVAAGVFAPGVGAQRQSNVAICHKGQTISVGQPAVNAHLGHGDTVGACVVTPPPPPPPPPPPDTDPTIAFSETNPPRCYDDPEDLPLCTMTLDFADDKEGAVIQMSYKSGESAIEWATVFPSGTSGSVTLSVVFPPFGFDGLKVMITDSKGATATATILVVIER